jgi:hypothetical protein
MLIVGTLALMSLFASIRDVDNVFDLVGVTLWCIWAPWLLAILVNRSTMHGLYAYSIFGAFAATSLFSFVLLFFIAIVALLNGQLNESGLIFVVFPYGFILFGGMGAMVGAASWWFMSWRRKG